MPLDDHCLFPARVGVRALIGSLLTIAGAGLAGTAMRASVVDRYLLRLVPTIVGGGTSALPAGVRPDLALQGTRRFGDGSVLLGYGLKR